MAINNQARAEVRDDRLDKIAPIYKAYQDARSDAIKQKAKYDAEMNKTLVDKTNVDNSVAYKELREMELKIATEALAKDPESKSLAAALELKKIQVKGAADNLKLKR